MIMEIPDVNYSKSSDVIILSKELIFSADTNVSNDSEEKQQTKRIVKKKEPKDIGFVKKKNYRKELQNQKEKENYNKKAGNEKHEKLDSKKKQIINGKGQFKENNNIISFVIPKVNENAQKNCNKSQKIKCKICFQIFEAVKKNENYKHFKKFSKIEKQIFSNHYEKLSIMAEDMRIIFNEYFILFATDAVNYPKIFSLYSHFENIYREFENKKFLNETKNILEIKKKMNKLQKIVKYNKIGNMPNTTFSNDRIGKYGEGHYQYDGREKRISNKFKLELMNNIKCLNTAQMKGMIRLLQNDNELNGITNNSNNSVELDINKLSNNKVKELDKYVRRCILDLKNRDLKDLHSENNNIQNSINKNELNSLLLGKKITNRQFFELNNCIADKQNEENNENKNYGYYLEENNNYFNSEKKSTKIEDNFQNKISFSADFSFKNPNIKNIIQNSITNPETPVSNLNKQKYRLFERGNSLIIDSDVDSDESSDEESYSDIKI